MSSLHPPTPEKTGAPRDTKQSIEQMIALSDALTKIEANLIWIYDLTPRLSETSNEYMDLMTLRKELYSRRELLISAKSDELTLKD